MVLRCTTRMLEVLGKHMNDSARTNRWIVEDAGGLEHADLQELKYHGSVRPG